MSDVLRAEALKSHCVTGVLNVNDFELTEEKRILKELRILYKYHPVPGKDCKTTSDFRWDLNEAACCLTSLSKRRKKVLVHCFSGVDRSPFVVVLHLARTRSQPIPDAYYEVKRKRPWVVEHYEWLVSKDH